MLNLGRVTKIKMLFVVLVFVVNFELFNFELFGEGCIYCYSFIS